ncbi:MAG: DUF1294 domain-containing protein [Clostridiaceae bacterium]|nr:DUF1294 domain-containing protein [Eubacteriales bacterium]
MKGLLPALGLYALVMNLFGFALMGFDKSRAQKNARRLRERALFLCAFLGGALGSLLGMYAFRHKTRKSAFRFGMPAIFILQLAALVAALYYL